jgi:hypothetical protein
MNLASTTSLVSYEGKIMNKVNEIELKCKRDIRKSVSLIKLGCFVYQKCTINDLAY